jgi:hypothetical protein
VNGTHTVIDVDTPSVGAVFFRSCRIQGLVARLAPFRQPRAVLHPPRAGIKNEGFMRMLSMIQMLRICSSLVPASVLNEPGVIRGLPLGVPPEASGEHSNRQSSGLVEQRHSFAVQERSSASGPSEVSASPFVLDACP